MSSEPAESNADIEQGDEDHESERPPAGASGGLTIALPEGCTSVSDAIVTNREMLREPQDHGLATEEDITHLSEAIEGLSGDVQAVSGQCEEANSTVADLQTVVEQQRRQIEELQSMVTSLADILGTEAEWQTFDDTEQDDRQ